MKAHQQGSIATTLPTLLDLLCRFREEDNVASKGEERIHLDEIITVITGLYDDARVVIDRYNESRQVTEVTEVEVPRVVLWYETPVFYWADSTYAVFMTSFIVSFFNEAGTAPQFGRLLLFLHKESSVLASYFDQLWQYDDYTGPDWRVTKPLDIQKRLVNNVWDHVRHRVDTKVADRDERAFLFESIMSNNVSLLQSGMGVSLLLAHMLVHYYGFRLNALIEADKKKDDDDTTTTLAMIVQ